MPRASIDFHGNVEPQREIVGEAPRRGSMVNLRALANAAHAVTKEKLRPIDHWSSGLGRGNMTDNEEWAKDPEAWEKKEKQKLAPTRQEHVGALREALSSIKKLRQSQEQSWMEWTNLPDDWGMRTLSGESMTIDRVPAEDNSGLIGNCYRSPVTGMIYLKAAESWRDFTLVDLWTRDEIVGCPEDIAKDSHVFWPIPLKKRTWIYHCVTRKMVAESKVGTMDESIQNALAYNVSDENRNVGEWSPVMWFAPMLPLVLLASDTLSFVMSFVMLLLCHVISILLNSAAHWWKIRLITLPLRASFVALLVWRLIVHKEFDVLVLIGFLAPIIGFITDFVMADLQMITELRYRCTYKVIRKLPNEVFVCQCSGNVSKKTPKYKEEHTGFPSGQDRVILIANCQGILAELLPLDPKKDGKTFKEENTRALDKARGHTEIHMLDSTNNDFDEIEQRFMSLRLKYFGLDVFDRRRPHVAEIEAQIMKKRWLEKWAEFKTAPPEDPFRESAMSFFGARSTRSNFGGDDYVPRHSRDQSKEEPLTVEDA